MRPPESHRAGRRLDGLTAALARLAVRQPRLALVLAFAAGALRNRLTRRWPSASQITALYPDLSKRRSVQIAAAIGALEEQNDLFVRCVRRAGIDPFRRLITIPDALRNLKGPCIFVTFHVGAFQPVAVALEGLGVPALSFRQGSLFKALPPVDQQSSKGNEQERAIAFRKAHRYLSQGGFVLMALDSAPGATITNDCLGRPLGLARGPFALARMTGAPMVPLVLRWTRPGGAEALVGSPLTPAEPIDRAVDANAFEQSLARSASGWLENYLRSAPEQLTLGLVGALLHTNPGAASTRLPTLAVSVDDLRNS